MVGYRDETVSLMQDITMRMIERAASAGASGSEIEAAVALPLLRRSAERLQTLLNDPLLELEADDGK